MRCLGMLPLLTAPRQTVARATAGVGAAATATGRMRACLRAGACGPFPMARRGAHAPARCPWRECRVPRSEEHTSELQSLMRISYAVFCLKNKQKTDTRYYTNDRKKI